MQESNLRVTVIRRNSIEGFKAGNLNNWLRKFGNKYRYFVIFDNDSLAEPDFITQLVLYAEHPENEHTAIFQSVILPWNSDNYFVRWVSALSPSYMMQMKRNANQNGTTISFGHNNLHRTSVFLELGGFNQELTSEDTVATFELDMIGYKTKIVDITSYEAEPANIMKYKRRAVRWAAQTMALFQQPWKQVSGALKVELSRQMIYYFINALFLFWVLGAIWFFDDLSLRDQFQQIIALGQEYDIVYFVSFTLVFFIIIIYFFLQFILALKCKIHVIDYLAHMVISSAIFFFTIVPVTLAILRGLLRRKVSFKPSNIETRPISLLGLTNDMKLVWGLSLIALLQYIINYRLPWNYLGGLWALFIFFTPLVLFYAHKYAMLGEDKHAVHKNKKQNAEKNIPA